MIYLFCFDLVFFGNSALCQICVDMRSSIVFSSSLILMKTLTTVHFHLLCLKLQFHFRDLCF
ncbi:hypothetical protein MtrunA17_Chr3g0108591 [Medicago truncatula]|uniref:Uncharacterized protein n=1 Tax=Medicago truncatula TaxID=3880 RepID=A0A396IQL3_MEDTR|nr:hypothetical protein MtrunA17_Chr3g0108591 [Medicago truncatula]